ncbi:hypothetical protein EX30DRAFT_342208 [Ascodesmis nigricans]|uniref:Rhodopsin domain-containing protein n=1 Tax=Ascodesmis nigricans TaxID=341454 RepID=A0A4S2MSX8_9PEZI|nr:hypothetical protein EX30DRAFT_342208 [Ascodesmis nigricans]
MTPEALLGCQVAASFICLLMIGIRLTVAHQKSWQPVTSERWGCGLFVFGCIMCLSCSVYWMVDAVKQLQWVEQGLSSLEIRLNLMSEKVWKGVYATALLAATCMWFGKFSFLLLYVPAYKQFNRNTKILYQVAIWFTLLCFGAILLIFIFYCSPIRRNWILDPRVGVCSTAISKYPLNVALILSIISDFIIFSIPVVLIIRLQSHSRAEYTSLAFLVALAIGSIAATTYFVVDANENNYNGGKPLPIDKRNMFAWNQVFANVLLLAAIAMPSVRFLGRGPSKERPDSEAWSRVESRAWSAKRMDRQDSYTLDDDRQRLNSMKQRDLFGEELQHGGECHGERERRSSDSRGPTSWIHLESP